MDAKLARDVRFLKIYAAVTTLVCGVLVLAAFRGDTRTRFGEIDVQRLNIVEPDGRIDLAISNGPLFPPPVLNGKVMKRSGDIGNGATPGMVFFNQDGNEQGGLAWNGRKADGKFRAGAALMFDQYDQDQTVGISYDDDNGRRAAGLNVWDHSDTPISAIYDRSVAIQAMKPGPDKDAAMKRLAQDWGAQRVFLGKRPDRSAVLLLADAQGKPRIRLRVDPEGNAKLEFLDDTGKTVYALPPAR